ncbi:MAG TPA: GAP family protein [Solirubrobacterales bacterium]|nr:GAP family protein [Solirubrobacterales bacterium]
MDILKILPLAFVMIAGPQIISAFFIATSPAWRRASAAYVLGAALSISLVVGASYLLTKGASQGGESSDSGLAPVDYVVLALLLFAMVRTYLRRDETEPPKWMGKLQTVTPKAAFALGFLLLGFFPSDLVTSISVGGFLAGHGDPYWHALPFLLLTLTLLSLPALAVAAMGERAQTVLPEVRDWMNQNSWIISEVVLVFFVAIVLSG